MANGDYVIDQTTWESLPVERQLWLIFSEFNQQRNECDARFCRVEADVKTRATKDEHLILASQFDRRKRVDTSFAAIMGFVGGLIGFVGSKLFR